MKRLDQIAYESVVDQLVDAVPADTLQRVAERVFTYHYDDAVVAVRGVDGVRRTKVKDLGQSARDLVVDLICETTRGIFGRTIRLPNTAFVHVSDDSGDGFERLQADMQTAFAAAMQIDVPLNEFDEPDFDAVVVPETTVSIATHTANTLYYLALQKCIDHEFHMPYGDMNDTHSSLREWCAEAHSSRNPADDFNFTLS